MFLQEAPKISEIKEDRRNTRILFFEIKLALRNLAPGNVEIYSESRISVIKVVNSRTSERVGLPNRSVRMDKIICCT